jgi:hypothetical protein
MKTSKHITSMETGISPELLNSGAIHIPDISRRHLAVPFSEMIGEEHLDALSSRVPIVSEEHIGAVRGPLRAVVYPDKIIEQARSAHGVGFGALRTRDRDNSFIKLALKPFNHYETAAKELGGYLWLAGLSIQTYQPFGIFPAEHGGHYISMSHTRKDLDSLDRDKWVKGGRVTSAEDQEVHERNERTVEDIAKCLAIVHSHGGFLPDSQIKNWAVTPEGKIGPIDTEKFKTVTLGDESSSQLAWGDIDMLVKSLVLTNDGNDQDKIFGVGMLSGMNLHNVRNAIERLFIEPYSNQLGEIMADSTDSSILEQCELLFSGVLGRFYSDEDWPQNFIDQQATHKSRRTAAVS